MISPQRPRRESHGCAYKQKPRRVAGAKPHELAGLGTGRQGQMLLRSD
jgi:hypothetical protein